MLGHLARAAGDDVLMAFAAALGIVRRTETVRGGFDFLEDEAVVVVRPQRPRVPVFEGAKGRSLGIEPVGQIVESGQGFACTVTSATAVVFASGPIDLSGRALITQPSIMREASFAPVVGTRLRDARGLAADGLNHCKCQR